MSTLLFKFVFLSNASPAAVLTSTELTGATAPTVNISSVALADGTTIASVVSGGALVWDSYTKSWSYRLAAADLATYAYTAMATTTYATASPPSVHALGIVIPDELVSTRLAPATAGRTLVVDAAGLADALAVKVGPTGTGTAQTARDLGATLGIAGAGLTAVPGIVWTHATRTLTSTAAATTAAVDGSTLVLSITASYAATLTGMTIPATWTKLWLTFKDMAADTDAKAILQLVVSNPGAAGTDGVLYVMAAAASVAQRTLGSLVVTQAAGTVAIALDETLSAVLAARSSLVYDIKVLESGGAATILTAGSARIEHTVTWAVV